MLDLKIKQLNIKNAHHPVSARSPPRILALPNILSLRFLFGTPIFNEVQLGTRLHPS